MKGKKFEDLEFRSITLKQLGREIENYINGTYYAHGYSIQTFESPLSNSLFKRDLHYPVYEIPLNGKITSVERLQEGSLLLHIPHTKDAFGKHTDCFGSSILEDITNSKWEEWSQNHTRRYPEFSVLVNKTWNLSKSDNGIIKLGSDNIRIHSDSRMDHIGSTYIQTIPWEDRTPPFLETIVPLGLRIVNDNGDLTIME